MVVKHEWKSDARRSSSSFRRVLRHVFSHVQTQPQKSPVQLPPIAAPWRQQRIIIVTQSTVVRRLPKPAWNRPWSPNAGGTSHRDQHKHTVRAAWPSSNKAATVCRTNKSFSLIVIEKQLKAIWRRAKDEYVNLVEQLLDVRS